jgi:hypothetical protein
MVLLFELMMDFNLMRLPSLLEDGNLPGKEPHFYAGIIKVK